MDAFVFYFFAILTLFSALGVLMHPNPILSALHLVASMIGVAGLFFILQAPFIAGVQLMVYAGAVMVLFLIVVMLFDLKDTKKSDFSPGSLANGFKVLFSGMFAGLIVSAMLIRFASPEAAIAVSANVPAYEVTNIAKVLYTEYLIVFETLGVLLLVIPIGTVALSRIRGGTHAQ